MKIGISIGDVNGIGLEVIVKTLLQQEILKYCTPIIYGSGKIVSYHKNIVSQVDLPLHNINSIQDRLHQDKINVINLWQDNVQINLGKLNDIGGKYALLSLEAAVRDLKEGHIDALVTAPIHKKSMTMVGFKHHGHTEYLNHIFQTDSLMLLVSDELRVGLVTEHLPLKAVPAAISKESVLRKIQLMHESLIRDFRLERPLIAVLGLNPHAGDEGLLGTEEEDFIRPAVVEAKKKGALVHGPFPADGFFGSGTWKKYDGILAMYHDQGLAPFKALGFGNGVNYTAGLPAVRTSPDHGTAFDLAGKNSADPGSFRQALFMALDIARNRKAYKEEHANPLRKRAAYDGEDEVITD